MIDIDKELFEEFSVLFLNELELAVEETLGSNVGLLSVYNTDVTKEHWGDILQ